METEKILEPLGKEQIKTLKECLGDNISEWLFRKRVTLDNNCPFDLLSEPTPKKVEQVKKVIQRLAEMRQNV